MKKIPGNFIFMKVGNHAGESWEVIIERKKKELNKAGMIFWGYGGQACHPIQQVQPFSRLSIQEQGNISLVMEPIDSKANPDIIPATEFSKDGINWENIPKGIKVLGSRYAFVLGEIKETDLEINFQQFEIGVGPSRGKTADNYIIGRVDKACLTKKETNSKIIDSNNKKLIHKIGFVAKLKDPFAVMLR